MNMTPLIDVTFLLIIFFMLVNNIVAEESVFMYVPELDQPQTIEFEGENRITVNVVPLDTGKRNDNWLDWEGEPKGVKLGMEAYSMDEMDRVTEEIKTWYKNVKAKGLKPQVLLRADGCLFYGHVQHVMTAITEAGVNQVHLVAYLPGESADDHR